MKTKKKITIQDYLDSITPYSLEDSPNTTTTVYTKEDVEKIMEDYGQQKYNEGYDEGWDECDERVSG